MGTIASELENRQSTWKGEWNVHYLIREKFWALGSDFNILDAQQQPVFQVDGAAFSWGDKLSLQDMQGNELAFISQRLLTLMPKYDIYRNGKLFAEVKKEFTWFHKQFALDVPGPNDYTIEGSFWDHEYVFRMGGRNVAVVTRRLFSLTHTYSVEIMDGEDAVSILATCIVIDQVLHDEMH